VQIRISFSSLALKQKQSLIKKYPGLTKHFAALEDAIGKNPLSGTTELMLNKKGTATPVRYLATKTEIFGGIVSYSKELIGVYVYSEKLREAGILQFVF
jgi:hypothetical protein